MDRRWARTDRYLAKDDAVGPASGDYFSFSARLMRSDGEKSCTDRRVEEKEAGGERRRLIMKSQDRRVDVGAGGETGSLDIYTFSRWEN